MQGIKRRIVYVTLFEGLAILITGTSFASLSGSGMDRAGAAAVFSSLIAVGWNFVYNLIFDAVFGLPASAMPVTSASETRPRT